MKKMRDRSGEVCGGVVIQRRDPDRLEYWICLCVCGNTKSLRGDTLSPRRRKSCCCGFSGRVKDANETHGRSRTTEWSAWKGMKARCYNKNGKRYHDYGGRGIRVCPQWLAPGTGFQKFLADMGKRPSPRHQVDRKDNDGPYSPENCHWATPPQQQRNRRNSKNYTYQGKTQCIVDWAREAGFTVPGMLVRVRKWGIEKAITTPRMGRGPIKAAK